MAPPNSGHRQPRPDPAPSWRESAACRHYPHLDWFATPDHERPHGPRVKTPAELAAINVCRTCPVMGHCLSYAVEAREGFGIFGGLTPAERSTLSRRRPRTAP